jgi:hypothetical protein
MKAAQSTGAIFNGVQGCPETQKRPEDPRMHEDVRWMHSTRVTVSMTPL